MTRPVIASTVIAVAAVIGVFVVGGLAQRQWSEATDSQCRAIHRIVVAGEQILDGEAQLRYAREKGLISRAEYREQVERLRRLRPLTERQLRLWRSADCVPPR
jgi:hypothetical protein